MSGRRLPDDEVDRLLREALADDLPAALEGELRRETRIAWRRAASERPARWQDWLGFPVGWRRVRPQPALVAAALVMLAAGAVMQAAPPPPDVLESFQGRQASALTARALGRATAMECAVVLDDERRHRVSYRIDWRAAGETRVRSDGGAGAAEWALHLPGAGPSVLTPSSAEREGASLDPALQPVRAYLSPAALGVRLAVSWQPASGLESTTPGIRVFSVGSRPGLPALTVVIDVATHLPLRLEATDREGRTQTAVCRWP